MLLEALAVSDPTSELIPKLVKHLLAIRKNGKWLNTQENCWVTIGLDRYFQGKFSTPHFMLFLPNVNLFPPSPLFSQSQSL